VKDRNQDCPGNLGVRVEGECFCSQVEAAKSVTFNTSRPAQLVVMPRETRMPKGGGPKNKRKGELAAYPDVPVPVNMCSDPATV